MNAKPSAIDPNAAQPEVNLGPIQSVFSLNLKDSLMAYQKFYDNMQKEKVDLRHKVKSKFNIRLLDLTAEDPETLARREALNMQIEQQMASIEAKFDKSVEYL